jgi:hypothetical protein
VAAEYLPVAVIPRSFVSQIIFIRTRSAIRRISNQQVVISIPPAKNTASRILMDITMATYL